MNQVEPLINKGLNSVLGIPIKLIVKLILCGVLLALIIRSCCVATHQYVPVVQRIHVDSTNWHGAAWINIQAAIDYELDEKAKEFVPGEQYFEFEAHLIEPSSQSFTVPDEVLSLKTDSIAQYTTLAITASGDDFKGGYPEMNKWMVEGFSEYDGALRVSEINEGHTIFLENYAKSAADAKMIIRGNNIFTDSDERNPYIAFHVTFGKEKSSWLGSTNQGTLTFNYHIGQEDMKDIAYPFPMKLVSVYPEPDVVSPTEIKVSSNFDQLLENGFYFIAEDLSKSQDNAVRTFLNSVLMGVYISFFIQFLIGLVKDFSQWLNIRSRKSTENGADNL